jgi:hypothetical protein
VSIKSVTGSWTTTFVGGPKIPETIDIVQNLTAVTASINGTADGSAFGMGSVSNPRSLSVTVTFGAGTPGTYNATFIGTLNDTLLTWSGTATGYMGCPCTFTATRPSAGP